MTDENNGKDQFTLSRKMVTVRNATFNNNKTDSVRIKVTKCDRVNIVAMGK